MIAPNGFTVPRQLRIHGDVDLSHYVPLEQRAERTGRTFVELRDVDGRTILHVPGRLLEVRPNGGKLVVACDVTVLLDRPKDVVVPLPPRPQLVGGWRT